MIGLKFPISKEYYEIISENDFGIEKLWLCHKMEIIDLHDLFFGYDEFFYDLDHLNKKGTELFCKEIHNALKIL